MFVLLSTCKLRCKPRLYMSGTISVVLFKSKVLKNGEHPIMIRITKNGKRSYKSIGISCNPKYWDDNKSMPKRSHPNKDELDIIIGDKLREYRAKQLDLMKDSKEFTSKTLRDSITPNTSYITVEQYFNDLIESYKKSHKLGNSRVYRETINSLNKFDSCRNLFFSDIDVSFLNKYESFMRSIGNSDNTISLRMRTLRAAYNRAIKEGHARKSNYPFDNYKVNRLNKETSKRALKQKEVELISKAKIEPLSPKDLARDLFMFSYYGMGINFIDMAELKWSQISDDRLFYTRKKTGKKIHFKLLDPNIIILNKWKKISNSKSDDYVFPILNKGVHVTPSQVKNRAKKVLGQVNKNLKELGKELNIDTPLTSYVARHSFATVLKNKGVTTAIISEAMGHKSESVTVTYLKSFENDVIDDAMKNLL